MASYFLDTSALVKRHVLEPGHAWIRTLCRPSAGHQISISEAALVEAIASFCRMAREHPPRLSSPARDRLIARFDQHVRRNYVVVLVNRSIYVRAANLCRVHPLRAYDAVQLACALTRRDDNFATGLPAPAFVSADDNLLAVARAEGFQVENPNAHP